MAVATLSEFFETTFKPIWIQGKRLDAKTEASYRESVSHWRNITGDPPMDEISDLTVAKFITALADRKGKKAATMANSSIHKHCRQIDTILQMAGPRSRHNKKGQSIIPEPPFFESPRVEKNPPQSAWSIDELRAMYGAADQMKRPQFEGVEPPTWWRTFICLAYYIGLRVTALLHLTWSMLKGCWLTVTAGVSKGRKGSRHYVHREALEHIETIRSQDREIILPFPHWDRGRRMGYEYLRDIEEAAGIEEDRQFGFHGFRKAHSSMIASLSLEHQRGLRTAQRSAGHSDLSITLDHYVSTDVQERLLVDAIDRMPSPCVRVEESRVERSVKSTSMKFVERAFEPNQEWMD